MNQKEINKAIQEGIVLKKQALKLIEDANLKSEEQIQKFKKTNEEYKGIVQNLKDINSEIQESKQNQQNLVDSYVQQEQKLKGLSGLQASLVDKDRARIELQARAKNLDQTKADTFNSIASLQNDLLNTSSEDVVQQAEINRKLDEHYASIEGSRGIHAQIRKNLMDQRKTATDISSLSETQQNFLNKQVSTYNTIRDTIGQTLETASLLTSTVGGVLGSALIGAGYAAEAIGKSVREFGGYLGTAQLQTIGLGFAFKDATSVTRELSNEFGGIEETSFRTKLNTNLMATNMGITGAQAAKITGTLARNANLTAQQAQDLAQSTKEFAIQNGVIPADVMGDVAENAEMFASYGKDATQELLKSAVQARKLGVSMSTLGKVTDGLLDFESSITKELELSAMLGRNINLNRARGLAFEGKTGAAVKETIKQLGGAAAFEKMNVIQRRQAAEALGLSVDELSKMANNMDKLNDDGSMQLSTFDTWSQSLSAFASGPLGKTLKGVGGIAIGLGQSTPFLKEMGVNFKGIGSKIGGMAKGMKNFAVNTLTAAGGLAKKGFQMLTGGADGKLGGVLGKAGDKMKSIGGTAKEKIGGLFKDKGGLTDKIKGSTDDIGKSAPKVGGAGKSGKGISSITKSISKIKMSDVVKGAAALVLIAGAMFILGKALQEFQGIGLDTLGIAGLALLGLTLSLAAVGGIMSFAGPLILVGAAAMILIAGAMYVLGKALTEIAKVEGIDLTSIGKQILGFSIAAAGLGALIVPLIGAGIALGMLGLGMAAFGLGISQVPTETNFSSLGDDIASLAISLSSLGGLIIPLIGAGIALGMLGRGMTIFGKGVSQVPSLDFASLGNGILSFGKSVAELGYYTASLSLAGIALAIAGAGLGVFGVGLSLIPIDVLNGLTAMVTNLVPLTDGIVSLAGAFTLLAGSLGLLSIAGIAALPTLIGLSAIGIGLGAVSALFGGGSESSESSTETESESISEYHQMVIEGLAAVKTAIDTKDMNVYIDGAKITDFVRKKSESATDNSNATLANA